MSPVDSRGKAGGGSTTDVVDRFCYLGVLTHWWQSASALQSVKSLHGGIISLPYLDIVSAFMVGGHSLSLV